MKELFRNVSDRAVRYLEQLQRRRVSPEPAAVDRLEELGGPLPETGEDPAKVVRLLDEVGSPATVASAGGRYFGFVTGGAVPAAVAAAWLAAAWDQNAAMRTMSPVANRLGEVALGWIRELLGLPAGSRGEFVTGTTMGNFTALAAARNAVLSGAGWDVESDGLFGAPDITVVVGAEAHATLLKALGMLGLGRRRVVTVPVDEQGRMRADALPPLDGPAIVCIQAGNVNSGAFDPAAEICRVARDTGAWVHVDGAFGLWAAAAPERAHLVDGYDQADSWATDLHKWLNAPYDSGVAFVRDPDALARAMATSADYLTGEVAPDPINHSPEGSRRARGVEAWAAIRSLGRSGVAELVERCCRHAARFAEGLKAAGHEVLNDVVLNQVVVSFGDDETTRRVIEAVQADGTCWCGDTRWRGRAAMRISVSSWATTEEDVERCLEAILTAAASADGTDEGLP